MAEVDLARLAASYEHRRRGKEVLTRALEAAAAARVGEGSIVLDVGGGRGGHASVFAGLGALAVVIDPSVDMAGYAVRAGVPSLVARGEHLPIADGCATLVYLHLSIHHGDAGAILSEARRVMAPGGMTWVWTLAAEHHGSSFLSRWFPSVVAIDEGRFPSPEALARRMRTLRFGGVRVGEHTETVVRTAGSWEAAVRAGFVSTLHLIDPAEVDEGLERFRGEFPDPDAMIEYRLEFRSVCGTGPGLVS